MALNDLVPDRRGTTAPAFFVTTVHRSAPAAQGGEVLSLDRASSQPLKRAAIVPTEPEIDEAANPRGGIRGGRGLLRLDRDHILVASYHSLLVFTNDLTLVDRHSHPLMSGVHAICRDGDIIWVTSTSIDMLLGYNLKTRTADTVIDMTELDCVQSFGITPRGLDLTRDFRADPTVVRGDSTHLNSVLKIGNQLLVLLNRFGAIIDVNADRVVAHHRWLRGGHDLVLIPDRGHIAVNDTRTQSLLLFDADGFALVDRLIMTRLPGAPFWLTSKKLTLYSQKIASRLLNYKIKAAPLFMRGLAYADGHLFSGISPAAVFVTDINAREIVEQHRLSLDTSETVYGILPAG